MSTVGSYSRHFQMAELNDPLDSLEGVLSPAEQKRRVAENLAISGASEYGTPAAGVSVSHAWSGSKLVSTFTFNGFVAMANIGDNASLAGGAAFYTLPDGVHDFVGSMMVGTVNGAASVTTDTPEIGVGTTVGSGANATLGAVGTEAENIAGPGVAASINNGAVRKFGTDSGPVTFTASSASLYLNVADGWADRDAGTVPLTFTGKITIEWFPALS